MQFQAMIVLQNSGLIDDACLEDRELQDMFVLQDSGLLAFASFWTRELKSIIGLLYSGLLYLHASGQRVASRACSTLSNLGRLCKFSSLKNLRIAISRFVYLI